MKFPPRLALALGVTLLLTACATIGPPQPPSLELPKPPTDLRAVRKGDRVILTWTLPTVTTDRQTARNFGATRICRALEPQLTPCASAAGEVTVQPNPAAAKATGKKAVGTYTDTLPEKTQGDDPSAFATYAIEVRNADGKGAGLSNQVRVPLMRTLPPPDSFRARVTAQGVALSWTNHAAAVDAQPHVRYVYRAYRRLDDATPWILAGELPSGNESEISLTDSSIEWEKTYEYRVETVSVISEEGKPERHIEGGDSPEIKVFADDVFPPAVPSGLQAVFSGPGQAAFIDLIWAPVPDVDLDGYNVYRREEGSAAQKVNAAPVKSPAYRDADVVAGKHYFYSVSAVDVRGNESARSEEAAESVP
jgi:hypothetical protein